MAPDRILESGAPVQLSDRGIAWYPSVAPKGSGADWENARRWFDERTENDWVELFDKDPTVMHHILGDIFREVRAQREARKGEARIGRRPKAINGSFAELDAMITPTYSMDRFPDALRQLMGDESLRGFSRRARLPHPTVARMMNGTMKLELYRLEQLAAAGDVHPAYFIEWREHHVLAAISQIIQSRPNLGIKLSRQIRALQDPK